jgi:hypothetical protein
MQSQAGTQEDGSLPKGLPEVVMLLRCITKHHLWEQPWL